MCLIHPEVPEFSISAHLDELLLHKTKWKVKKKKKEVVNKTDSIRLVQRFKWVLKIFCIVMRRFKKSLLLLLENFLMKNSILVHEIIDQTLSFIFATFYYYFKLNQRNSCYKLGNMNSKFS